MPTEADRPVVGRYHDVRDAGRWMQITWHPARGAYVLSLWRDNVCAATFQLDRANSAEVIADLARSLSLAQPRAVELHGGEPVGHGRMDVC